MAALNKLSWLDFAVHFCWSGKPRVMKACVLNEHVKKLPPGKVTIPEKRENFELTKANVGVLLLVLNLLK